MKQYRNTALFGVISYSVLDTSLYNFPGVNIFLCQ